MTTSSMIDRPTGRPWADLKAEAVVPGHQGSELTVSRAGGRSEELVFIEVDSDVALWVTREQAADLAEAVHEVSGMATSTHGAQFLAEAVVDRLAREGVSQARVCAETGMTRYRLRQVLSGTVPMTNDELKAISEVDTA